jgi:hypothetical protein
MQNNILEHNKQIFLRGLKNNVELFNIFYSCYYGNDSILKMYCDALFKSYYPEPILDRIWSLPLFREHDRYGVLKHYIKIRLKNLTQLAYFSVNDYDYIYQRFKISSKRDKYLLVNFCKNYGIIPDSNNKIEHYLKIGKCYYINRELEIGEAGSIDSEISLTHFIFEYLNRLNDILKIKLTLLDKIKRNFKIAFLKKI